MSHVGRIPCVDFDRFAQVEDRIASHVQRDLMMIAMIYAFNDDEDQNDAFDDEALDDEEHHFLGLDKGLGVVDNGQA